MLPPRRPPPKEDLPRKKAFPLIGMLFSGKPKGSVVQFPLQIMIDHRADGSVGPDVFRCFYHVDNRVNRQDDAHDADWRAGATHEGERQEIAAHGDAGVSDGREDGDDDPGDECGRGEFHTAVLHEEEGRNQNESGAAVHIDRGANGKDEAGHFRIDFHIFFGAGERHGECPGAALCEEGDGQGPRHLPEDFEGIQPARQEEERNDEENLNEIRAHDDEGVFPERPDDDTGFNLRGELRGVGQDAERERPDEGVNEREEKFLETVNPFQQDFAIFRARHEGEREPHGGRNQHDGEDVSCQKRTKHIVRHDGEEVIVIGHRFQIRRDFFLSGEDKLGREIPRRDVEIKRQADAGGGERRQKGVRDGVREDFPRFLLPAERGQRGDDGERNRGHGDELEEARVNRRDEVEEAIHLFEPHPAERGADDERQNPEDKLLAVSFFLFLLIDGFADFFVHTVFIRIHTVLLCKNRNKTIADGEIGYKKTPAPQGTEVSVFLTQFHPAVTGMNLCGSRNARSCAVSGAPGFPYCDISGNLAQKCTSAPLPHPLSLSGLALRNH